jgi:hypothetical protein
MITLADAFDGMEKLLSGQSGVALGLILGGAISALGLRFFLNPIIENTKATNRLCKAVANLLIESELKAMQLKGREILSEMEETK